MKHAQTALEYLVTYGWAILVIVIIAALFWMYFNPSDWIGGEQASGFSGLTIGAGDFKLSSDGNLSIIISNGLANSVVVTNVSCGSASVSPNTQLHSGSKSSEILVAGTGITGNKGEPYSITVSITYNVVNGVSGKISSGTLKGKFS